MTGARTRRMRRIAASTELGDLVENLRKHGDGRDGDWMLRHDSRENQELWLVTPISHSTREDDALDDSNYEVAEQLIREVSGFSRRCEWPAWTAQDGTVFPATPYLSGGTASRHDAWPGGTIETLLVRADDAPALRVLGQIIDALTDYPLLDDTHHAALKWDRAHPSDHECYSEDEMGCPCAVRNHDHTGPEFLPADADEDGEIYCRSCSAYVVPGTRAGDGNTHGED